MKDIIKGLILFGVIVLIIIGYKAYLINNSQIYINSIIIPQNFIDNLNTKFTESPNSEFAFCFKGNIKNSTVIITEIISPEVFNSEIDTLEITCPKGTIGSIHNHLNKICILSVQDAYSFGMSKHSFMGIICDNNNINLYTPDSLIKPIPIVKI